MYLHWQHCKASAKETLSCFIACTELFLKQQVGRKNKGDDFNVITSYQVSMYKVLCACAEHLTYVISFNHQDSLIRHSYFSIIQRG